MCVCVGVCIIHTHIHTYVCYKGGPLGALSREAKFEQDVKTRSKHSGEDVIYGMGGLIRT